MAHPEFYKPSWRPAESFQEFLGCRERVSYQEFFASQIGRQSCIEDSWWPHLGPTAFVILDREYWFAEFADGSFWTLIEKQELTGNLHDLALEVWDWLGMETN